MITSKLLPGVLFTVLLKIVVAQTPAGFNPSVTQNLKVSYGSNDVTLPGKLIPRAETANPPTINVPKSMISGAQKGLVFMIDLDIPIGNPRMTNLHWLAPNADISKDIANIPKPAPAPYRQPTPPKGDIPHRYVFLLYSQPNNFTMPPKYSNVDSARIGFDIKAFAKAAGLGNPEAANYITVQQT